MSDYTAAVPVRTDNNGDVVAQLCDKTVTTQKLTIDAAGLISSKTFDGAGVALTSQVNGAQRALDVGIDVAGVQVDPRQIRALTASDVVAVNLRDEAGVAFSDTNPLQVTIEDSPGTPINDFKKVTALGAATSNDHDYTVTAGKTLHLNQVEGSAAARSKMNVQIETGVATGVFNSFWVLFGSATDPNMHLSLRNPIDVAAGVRVRVTMTNLDNQADDVYSTISGFEV